MAYQLSDEELRQVQLIELELLIEVDRICKKNNIKYNIIAGTLLGAVRHKGYIPWDDDADVALLREEYAKFTDACRRDLDHTKYYFQDFDATEGYRWGYGKLRRKDTLFLRENQENMPYEQGIFIDVFPLDQVPDFYPARILTNFHCFCIRKVLWSEVGKKVSGGFKKKVYEWINHIPLNRVIKHYKKMCEKLNRKDTKWVRILLFPTPNKSYGYLKKWYEESELIEFEGELFSGIKDYKEYLSFKFGNYTELPPVEERKTHPISRLKLLE